MLSFSSRLIIAATGLLLAGHLLAETPPLVKMNHDQAHGALFDERDTQASDEAGFRTWDEELFLTEARDMDMGLWRSEAFTETYDEPWPYHEFIHVTEGSVVLTSTDGTVMSLAKGDSAMIPMGWTGTWDTPGMTKIYVIYAPNKDL